MGYIDEEHRDGDAHRVGVERYSYFLLDPKYICGKRD